MSSGLQSLVKHRNTHAAASPGRRARHQLRVLREGTHQHVGKHSKEIASPICTAKKVTAVTSPLENKKEKLLGKVRQPRWAGEETPGCCAASWNRVRSKLLAEAVCPSKSDAVIVGVEEELKPSLEDYSGILLARYHQISSLNNWVFTT